MNFLGSWLKLVDFIGVAYGYGKAEKTLTAHDNYVALLVSISCLVAAGDLGCWIPTNTVLKTFWLEEMLYKVTINLTKISILVLYLRIFPAKRLRMRIKLVMLFVFVYAIGSIGATAVECLPIAKIFDHTLDGVCINTVAFWYTNGFFNTLGDIAVLVLPLGSVNNLQLPRRQKLGLYIIFSMGGLSVNPISVSLDTMLTRTLGSWPPRPFA